MESINVDFCEQCGTNYGIIQKDKKSGLELCEFCKDDLDNLFYVNKKKNKHEEEE